MIEKIVEVEKFNPYHDRLGRFATAGAATSFTYKPGKSKAHDMAIAREKERMAALEQKERPATIGTFTKAKSMDEAIAYASTMVKDGQFTVENLHLNTVNAFNEAMYNVEQRFHQKLNISGVQAVKRADANYMQGSYNPSNQKVQLKGGKSPNAMSTYEKNAEKFFESRWNSSKDPLGVFYHEIGHAVWTDLSSKAKSEINAVYQNAKHKAYQEWMSAGGSRSGLHQADFFGKMLSKYGAQDVNEFFSETFSQIMSGRMRPVSREVNSILNNQYKKVNKSYEEIVEIEKFNPYHDRLGRFASAHGGKVKLQTSITDAYGGEIFNQTTAYIGDKEAGYLKYSVYDGTPSVQYIETSEEFKRQGVATQLMQELQRQYPDTEIDFGMTTPDGSKFIESITYEVKNPKVIADKRKLSDLKEELKRTEKEMDEVIDMPDSPKRQARLDELGERWGQLYDTEIPALEEQLRGKKESQTFVKLEKSDMESEEMTDKVGKSFDQIIEIEKNNPYHDPKNGQFASAPGGSGFSDFTNKKGKVVTAAQQQKLAEMMASGDKDTANKYQMELGISVFSPEFKKITEKANELKASQPKKEPPSKKPQIEKPQTKPSETKETKEVADPHKEQQLAIIQRTNPMRDDHHVGIRRASDILTAQEAFNAKDNDEGWAYPDWDYKKGQKALASGKVTIYSSNPIKEGAFVSPSKAMASDYAGGGKVYSKTVSLDSVAWINTDEGQFAPIKKSEESFSIFKTDDDKRLVFGWASISITVDGEQLEDRQKDMIDPEDLEEAVYDYVLNFRDTGEEHIPTMRKKGKLVESCVFTAEKQKAMGIPEGILPVGWWIGFHIDDDDAWERVKNGTYKMFSIEGKGERKPVEKSAPVAKTFNEILEIEKFNPYHDRLGRFATANGATSFTYSPGKSKAHDNAIAREKERQAGGGKQEDKREEEKPSTPNRPEQTKHMYPKEFFGDADTVEAQARVLAKNLSESSGQKVTPKQADKLWDSVLDFTTSSFSRIRETQRTGKGDKETKKTAENIEKYIEIAPKWNGGTLYRGINVSKDVLAKFKPGQKFDNGGTSSWTDKQDNARTFIGGKGTKVMFVMEKTKSGTSISHLSNYPRENEVIVSKKATMTVKTVQKKRGVTYVYVEES